MSDDLSHVGPRGRFRMVDVSSKSVTSREAKAAGRVSISKAATTALHENDLEKGDALGVARLAGIQAAKRTSEWLPLCHNVPLDQVDVEVELDLEACAVLIRSHVRARGVTGVEMEALVAVSAAGLAVYDMIKAVDRDAIIGPVGVVEKTGGRTGPYRRDWPPAPLVAHREEC
ncbi:MAG: cyclic pyranopterin monophosphate synthase MoaC [Acidobacteriota bacterium]